MYFRKPAVRSLFLAWTLLEDYKPYHQPEFFLFTFMIRNHSQQGVAAGIRWPNWFLPFHKLFSLPLIFILVCRTDPYRILLFCPLAEEQGSPC